MKSVIFIILILSNFIYSQNNFGFNGSKFFFLNKNFGAIVQENNTIEITSDGAKSWKQISIGTDEELRKVLFTSESRGWLIAEKSIYNTVDSGNTWQKNHSFQVIQLNALYFIDNESGFIGGDGDTSSTIYFTNDSGNSWMHSTIDSALYYSIGISDFSFINDSIGIVIGVYTIYKTQNGGNFWQRLPLYFLTGNGAISSGKMLDKDNIIITAWYPAVWAEGYLLSSTDGGMNWSKYGDNYQTFDFGIQDEYIPNKDSIWLIANSNKVYFTKNGGEMWDTLDIQLNMFSFFSKNQAYGLGGKYLYYSDDGWNTYNMIDSTITSINEPNDIIKTPRSIILYQNYPNPFNPTTTISYQIANESYVTLKVYDILGKEVDVLVNGEKAAGNYSITFDASKLTSGVYFYRIKAGNYSDTKKFVLLK